MKDKLRFLIAQSDSEKGQELKDLIAEKHPKAMFFFASNGVDASSKIDNAPPDIVFSELNLPKVSGLKLAESIIENKVLEKTAIILLAAPPDKETFVDEVVTGRVQFLADINEQGKLHSAIERALGHANKSSAGTGVSMKQIKEGDLLIKQGDQAESVFILKSGRLEASYKVGEEDRKVLGHVEPGEFVGEMAYINGEPRSADVTATTDSELIEIPINLLDHVLFKKPAWAKALMKTLSKRVKSANLGDHE